ncbi:uncharacterized protein LOC131154424 isoform X2 [Malania oleifera]|uniref:uncharacterized protein LOC131154424 isoform X2 n=1 Tax=Malania oleifera TaxID=397392 RepID=UPI0025ADCB5D|nr:uncharacterized protein LOC131154424 isoform X2 [Malania oleifera]
MASKDAEELLFNTETEEETIAVQKKRSRRVSFAEITSVHVFDRDDELETPPDSKPFTSEDASQLGQSDGILGFLREAADSDDSRDEFSQTEEDDEDDDLDQRKSFLLRPLESPSPGSTIGSATSNDEENFFGPVSASFIRPRQLSDSAMSDENHDITMDSTAFSMHFRSLARSDSAGDIKTPTRLTFEEKTPVQNTASSNVGSFMVLTGAKKPIFPASVPADKVRAGTDSNDMSLIGENPHKYDFERLSPGLDALLAQGSKDLRAVLLSDDETVPKSPNYVKKGSTIDKNKAGIMDSRGYGVLEPANIVTHGISIETMSIARNRLGDPNDDSTATPIDRMVRTINDAPTSDAFIDQQIQTPILPTRRISPSKSQQSIKNALERSRLKLQGISPSKSQQSIRDALERSRLKLMSAIKRGSASSTVKKVLQLDFSEEHESSYLSSIEGLLEEICPQDGRHASEISQKSVQKDDSPIVGTTLDYGNERNASGTSGNFVSSPVRKRLSTSPGFQGSSPRSLKHLDQHVKLISFTSGQDADSVDVPNATESTAMTDNLDFLSSGRRLQSSLSFMETNHLKDLVQINRKDERAINFHDLQNESNAFGNFQTPVRNKGALHFQSGNLDRNLQTGTDPTRFIKDHPGGRITASFFGSASPCIRRIRTAEQEIQSSSRKDSFNTSDNDGMHIFVGKDMLSPTSSSFTNEHVNNDHHHGHDVSQTRVLMRDIENSSGRKRRSEEIILGDGDNANESARIQRSSKVHRGGGCDLKYPLQCFNESNSGAKKIEGYSTSRHWTDIFAKISGDAKQLLFPLTNKLNLQAIGVLEDIVVHLQKVKAYELLCSQVQSQKTFDPCRDSRHKRVAEARSLLYKMAYEHAKLQLTCLKRERLQKRVKLLSSGVQESQMLKLTRAAIAQMNDSHTQSRTINLEGKKELALDKVTAMRQELEVSDRKIKNLTESFYNSCKTMNGLNSADTIVSANAHLKRRMCSQFICQDLQLWEVDDLKSKNGTRTIVLNYKDLIFQRFTVNTGAVSSIVVLNKPYDIVIAKKFPNMEACVAFAFVLSAETTRKCVGLRSLAQQTQIISSLLSNLLDVLDEVQFAQIEFRNLTHARFHSPSVQQLDLEFCFIDFKSGKKAVLTLDMTSLNCGVYPSDILPFQLKVLSAGTEESPPQSLCAEIRAALERVTAGYRRIVRLCTCVSQVVKASGEVARGALLA